MGVIKQIPILVAILIFLTSCSTHISAERIASEDYGPPPNNYEQIIRDYFNKILIDPTSPIFEFDKARKGYTKESSMFHTQEQFGWRVCGTVNSKNKFGGYAGRIPFFALFRGDHILELISGEVADSRFDNSFRNAAVAEACRR